MPVVLDHMEGLCFLRVKGEANIASAAELKQLLVQALGTGKGIRLDLEHATEMDLMALQLLWATERAARAMGVGFILAGAVPEEISAAAIEAGFETFPVPAGAS
jgi:anti-anti-sigma factor